MAGWRRVRPWVISGAILATDQLTKLLIVGSFRPGESRPFCPPILYWTYVQNTGAAFGLFKGRQMLFVGFSLLIIGWLVWELRANRSLAPAAGWGCALVLGGAVGNLMDRLRLSYVIDFIDLRVWPVFNVGDSAITIGVALLLLSQLPSLHRYRFFRPQP